MSEALALDTNAEEPLAGYFPSSPVLISLCSGRYKPAIGAGQTLHAQQLFLGAGEVGWNDAPSRRLCHGMQRPALGSQGRGKWGTRSSPLRSLCYCLSLSGSCPSSCSYRNSNSSCSSCKEHPKPPLLLPHSLFSSGHYNSSPPFPWN